MGEGARRAGLSASEVGKVRQNKMRLPWVKDKITVLGLDAKMIVGGHGGSISYEALLKLLEL